MVCEGRRDVTNDSKGFALRNQLVRVTHLELEKTGAGQAGEEEYLEFLFEHVNVEVPLR